MYHMEDFKRKYTDCHWIDSRVFSSVSYFILQGFIEISYFLSPAVSQVLSQYNKHLRFSALLWLEELHAERELKEFTINGAILKKGAVYLHLEVLGLAEGRPSLYIGVEACNVFLHCWINVEINEFFMQYNKALDPLACFTGDRIVLKKPQRDGVVMEYVSYVTEVGSYLVLWNLFLYSALSNINCVSFYL